MGHKPGGEEPEEDDGDMSLKEIREHQEACAEELFEAIEHKDAKKFVECYSTIHKLDHEAMDKEDAGDKMDEQEPEGEDEAAEE